MCFGLDMHMPMRQVYMMSMLEPVLDGGAGVAPTRRVSHCSCAPHMHAHGVLLYPVGCNGSFVFNLFFLFFLLIL